MGVLKTQKHEDIKPEYEILNAMSSYNEEIRQYLYYLQRIMCMGNFCKFTHNDIHTVNYILGKIRNNPYYTNNSYAKEIIYRCNEIKKKYYINKRRFEAIKNEGIK